MYINYDHVSRATESLHSVDDVMSCWRMSTARTIRRLFSYMFSPLREYVTFQENAQEKSQ